MSRWQSVYVEGSDGRLRERIDIYRSSFKNVTSAQWKRLEGLLTVDAVVESAWLQSAAGIRRDAAGSLLRVLAQSGAGRVTRLVFHDCAEHPVSNEDHVGTGWRCPECERVAGNGTVRFETRVTVQTPVRLV